MGPIEISLRTLTISCYYLRCRVVAIRLHWINSDIKQIYSLRFAFVGYKLATLRFIVNYGNLKWLTGNSKWPTYVYTIYLNQICIGLSKKCLLGFIYIYNEKSTLNINSCITSAYILYRLSDSTLSMFYSLYFKC